MPERRDHIQHFPHEAPASSAGGRADTGQREGHVYDGMLAGQYENCGRFAEAEKLPEALARLQAMPR